MASVGELVRDAAARLGESGSETPRLDAELLLGHVLHSDRTSLLAAAEAPVSGAQREAFEALVAERATGKPVAYLRGLKEFFGLALAVDERALIPRPETERLVEVALERLSQRLADSARPAGTPPLQVWDVGTGSGAIAIAVAVECRRRGYAADVRMVATDISTEALALAVENAVAHGVADAIEFRQADLAATDPGASPTTDLLLANLPYIPSDDVPRLPVAASFEPPLALDGGPDGLALIGRLLEQLPGVLDERGTALLEIGADQQPALQALLAERLPGWTVEVHLDLGGRPRVAEIERPDTAT